MSSTSITIHFVFLGNNNSSDKLEFEFVQPHHSHGVSMDIDQYQRNKVYPMRDRDIIYGSYGHAYEGGTFPRKKEQRVRIPSNPSVASKSSDMKDSTGSIEHSEVRQQQYIRKNGNLKIFFVFILAWFTETTPI